MFQDKLSTNTRSNVISPISTSTNCLFSLICISFSTAISLLISISHTCAKSECSDVASDIQAQRRYVVMLAHLKINQYKTQKFLRLFFASMLSLRNPRNNRKYFITLTGKYHEMSHVMRKPVFAICEQQRRRSACASAQSDQRLCYSLLT